MLSNVKSPIKLHNKNDHQIDSNLNIQKKSDLLVINQPSQDNKANKLIIFCYNQADNYYL